MSRAAALLALCLILAAASASAEMVAGLPLHVHKYDSGAIRVWIGDHVSSTAVMAFPTSDGLVIIDTTGNPKVDAELRKVIARELGRDDFKVLINTHQHEDHTGGNAVYKDCTIVGHELVAAGMNRDPEQLQRMVDWLTNRVAEQESELAAMAADAPQRAALEENLTLNRMVLEAAQVNNPLVVPTQTFKDRKVLKMGDTTFEMYYIGGMHSDSDIAILVPEHGLLMTGDTMADVWLTDTPGCLASFIARPGVQHDFPLLLKNWNALLARKDEIHTLIPGHWNGELTFDGFENRVKYVEALWEGAHQAALDHASLSDYLTSYTLADRFPQLVDSPGCSQGNTYTTMTEMWATVTDQLAAAPVLFSLLEEGADEAAIRNVVAQHTAEKPTHYFLESQVNAYGYRFLQSERPAQAVAMFRINVELFPDSWNVYDSLGEALYAMGENKEALAMYEKSLELNPESPTGAAMLAQIKAAETVN